MKNLLSGGDAKPISHSQPRFDAKFSQDDRFGHDGMTTGAFGRQNCSQKFELQHNYLDQVEPKLKVLNNFRSIANILKLVVTAFCESCTFAPALEVLFSFCLEKDR